VFIVCRPQSTTGEIAKIPYKSYRLDDIRTREVEST
jgi:hypothetical protein